MPLPVSHTLNWTHTVSSVRRSSSSNTSKRTPPSRVNLMALSKRLIKTWFILAGSPFSGEGMPLPMVLAQVNPLSMARCSNVLNTCSAA